MTNDELARLRRRSSELTGARVKLLEGLDKALLCADSIQRRVYLAINDIAMVRTNALGDLGGVFDQILEDASSVDASVLDIAPAGDGKYQVTCMAMTSDDAVAMMKRLITLREDLNDELYQIEARIEEDG